MLKGLTMGAKRPHTGLQDNFNERNEESHDDEKESFFVSNFINKHLLFSTSSMSGVLAWDSHAKKSVLKYPC